MNSGVMVVRLMVHRFRRIYFVFAVFLVAMVGVAQLPITLLPDWMAGILCVAFGFGLLTTVFGFVNFEADISSTASAFSPWLLRLPIKTRVLAFGPIAAAAMWAFVSWTLFTVGFLWQRRIHAPLIWPALMFVALALSMQAILWRPVRLGNVRLVLSLVLSTSILLFGSIAGQMGWNANVISEVYGCVACVSAVGAWWSLKLARTSASIRIKTPQTKTDGVTVVKQSTPFKSPRTAQFWLEWRRQGRLLPLLTGLALLALSIPLFVSQDKHVVGYTETHKAISVNIWMTTAIGFIPWIPLLFASVIGMGARPSDIRAADGNYHVYFATRPLPSQDMVRAKMLAIACGVAITAVMTLLVILLWICMPATIEGGQNVPYFSISYFKNASEIPWMAYSLTVITLIAWTWRNQTVGAFVDYMPSTKFAMVYPLAVTTIGAFAFALTESFHAELQETKNANIWIAAFVVGLVVKLSAAVFVSSKQLRLRPESKHSIWVTIAWWQVTGIVAAVIVGVIRANMHRTELPSYFVFPVPELAALMLVPLVRPLGARLALELGRHR